MTEERKLYYINLIKTSYSLREVCIKSNIVVTTGNYNTLKKIITENNIDISHFKRQGGVYKKPEKIEYYLTNNSTIASFKLKNKLFKHALKEKKCECCGLTEWMGKPINLQLHHINGINTDNRLENLQILCPNCHSFTDNFSGKNQKNNIKERNIKINNKLDDNLIISLLNENKDIEYIANKLDRKPSTILKHIKKNGIKIEHVKKTTLYNVEEMFSLMREFKTYSTVGKIMGVSDNAIKKRFIKLGYPSNKKDLLKKLLQ